MGKRKNIIVIILGVWIWLGSLFGNIIGTPWNVLKVQASSMQLPEDQLPGNQPPSVNHAEVRRLMIYDESYLNTWLWFKETDAGRNIAQTITHIIIYDVEMIPDYAFANMGNLNTVVFDREIPPSLGELVFHGEETQEIDFWVPYNADVISAYQSVLHNQLGHFNFNVDGIQHTLLPEGENILLPEISASGETVPRPEENNLQSSTGQQCGYTHTWIQKEYIAATTTEDAVVIPICQDCGIMGSLTKRPGSAHVRFLKDTAQQIVDAEVNATIMVTSELWFSTNHLITDAMAARKDVSLTINYRYEGKYYTVTIPAGTDMATLLGENGWVGFRYVDSVFPGRELMPEEWKDLRK